MLVFVAAAALAQWDFAADVPCTGEYSERRLDPGGCCNGGDGLYREACRIPGKGFYGAREPGEDNYCSVSYYYHCCGFHDSASGVVCVDLATEQDCTNFNINYEWCGDTTTLPAEPADDGLSEAIITVIVLVSLIAVAGVAGAYAIFCRGT